MKLLALTLILFFLLKYLFSKKECSEGGKHECVITGTGFTVCSKCKEIF